MQTVARYQTTGTSNLYLLYAYELHKSFSLVILRVRPLKSLPLLGFSLYLVSRAKQGYVKEARLVWTISISMKTSCRLQERIPVIGRGALRIAALFVAIALLQVSEGKQVLCALCGGFCIQTTCRCTCTCTLVGCVHTHVHRFQSYFYYVFFKWL